MASSVQFYQIVISTKVTWCLVVQSAVAQCLALWKAKDIFDLVVTKLVMRGVSIAFGGADRSPDIYG
jgi:hypothetical protein